MFNKLLKLLSLFDSSNAPVNLLLKYIGNKKYNIDWKLIFDPNNPEYLNFIYKNYIFNDYDKKHFTMREDKVIQKILKILTKANRFDFKYNDDLNFKTFTKKDKTLNGNRSIIDTTRDFELKFKLSDI